MALILGTDPASAGGGQPPPLPIVPLRRGARRLQLPRSLKVRIGLGFALGFIVLAVIGPWIAPHNPNTSLSTTSGIPHPPSAANWLGTTQVQQDVLSQLLTGGASPNLASGGGGPPAT